MKKIGLITFHDTANHGAALQLYATLKAVSDMGYEIEVIDYTNSFRSSFYDPKKRLFHELKSFKMLPALKTLVGFNAINKRMNAFDKFYIEHTKRSIKSYSPESEMGALNEIYDVLLCGSDQIWSTRNNGHDFNYLLQFSDGTPKLISYASSLGMTEISSNAIPDYKRLLGRFDSIAVREKPAAILLESILDRHIEVVLDPVFLLTAAEWMSLVEHHTSGKNPAATNPTVLLDYTAHKGMLEKFLSIEQVSNEFVEILKFGTNLRVLDYFDSRMKLYSTAGPLEFIEKLLSASFIFTSSFHGTVLSIIFRKQFVTALSGNEGRDSRIVDLLEKLGLTSRIFRDDLKAKDIFMEIDYDEVHRNLEYLREKSLSYLMKALEN